MQGKKLREKGSQILGRASHSPNYKERKSTKAGKTLMGHRGFRKEGSNTPTLLVVLRTQQKERVSFGSRKRKEKNAGRKVQIELLSKTGR